MLRMKLDCKKWTILRLVHAGAQSMYTTPKRKQQVMSRILYLGAHISLIHQYPLVPTAQFVYVSTKTKFPKVTRKKSPVQIRFKYFPGMVMTKIRLLPPYLLT